MRSLRQLSAEEMALVSGGGDSIVVTGSSGGYGFSSYDLSNFDLSSFPGSTSAGGGSPAPNPNPTPPSKTTPLPPKVQVTPTTTVRPIVYTNNGSIVGFGIKGTLDFR